MEWLRFVEEYLDKPGDTLIDKTRKIHDNYIYDFVFDDGHIKNIYLVNKQDIAQNKVQVINQFEQTGTQEIAMMLQFWSMVCHWYKSN